MSQSAARQLRRQAERKCKNQGHLPKNGGPGERYCARCLEPLPLTEKP